MTMEIKKLRGFDVDVVVHLMFSVQAAHVSAYPHRYQSITEAEVRIFVDELLRNDAGVLVAAERDDVMGYAVYELINSPPNPFLRPRRYCYLQQIGVSEDFQGRGVAKQLFDCVRRAANDSGVSDIELDVGAFNERAKLFFERVGCRPFGIKMYIA